MHVRLCDIFDHNRNVKVPCPDRLVVRSGHKSPIFVNECDGVHWSQMLIVFLSDLTAVDIVLKKRFSAVPEQRTIITPV